MSEHDPLPELRPVRLQGRAYYAELRRILAEEEAEMRRTINAWKAECGGITPAMIGALALKHRLNVKATCEALEEWQLLRCGVYDRIRDGGIRPTDMLRAGQEWLRQRNGPTAIEAAFEQAREKKA